jgi:hypothetical protein
MRRSGKPIITHNTYPTGCHHHKKRGRKELLKQQRSIQVEINRISAHPSCRSRRHRSQQRRQHCRGPHCNNLLSSCSQRIRKQCHKPMSPSLQPVLPTNKTKASPSDEDLHYSVPGFILYCGASELKQRRAFVWLRKRKKK